MEARSVAIPKWPRFRPKHPPRFVVFCPRIKHRVPARRRRYKRWPPWLAGGSISQTAPAGRFSFPGAGFRLLEEVFVETLRFVECIEIHARFHGPPQVFSRL